jgi:hypothetical protein
MKNNPNTYINKYSREFGKNRITRKLLEYPFFGIMVHWVFQGMLIMDKTEKVFKILIDIFLTLVLSQLFIKSLERWIALLLGLLIAHTINFIFNAHYWTVLKHYGYINLTYEAFERYIQEITHRIEKEPSITYGAIYGSLAREEGWRPSTDLDLRLIRRRGLVNGIRACSFTMRERSLALFRKFPIDLYLLDSSKPLVKMRCDENPIIIKRS